MTLGSRAGRGAVALAAAIVAAALATAPAPAATPALPSEVVSPLAGTPDAMPGTQISFLGAPASDLRDIVVHGSLSGYHGGQLEPYSTGNGASFVPYDAFEPGETVTVTATLASGSAQQQIGTTFTVGDPYALTHPTPLKKIPATATNVMHFHSRHDLQPPAVTVTTPAADPGLGDILISPDSGPGQPGPMIVTPAGSLVWFDPLSKGETAFDLDVQRYRGQRALTWWQGEIIAGHGQGEDVIADDHYRTLAVVRAGNGLDADLHAFEITGATAWISAYEPEHMNLSADGGLADGLIDDCVIQEIDIRTGLVMFEWHALGHVPLSDAYTHAQHTPGEIFDWFHLNSIDPQPGGNLLISSRNTWTVYMISTQTGAIEWQVGGRQSTIALPAGVRFAWQHDATLLPGDVLSVFDNEAGPAEAAQSRGLELALDLTSRTASVVRTLTYPAPGIRTDSQGDVQWLANGDALVGWGQVGEVSEFSPTGALTFDMHLAPPAGSYRAVRVPWSGQPLDQPALAAAAYGAHRTQLYASWNGATDVARWRVLAGSTPTRLAAVGSYAARGFETPIGAPTAARYVRVQALSASGALLRSSPVVAVKGR